MIVVDVDGCLLDWHAGFLRLTKARGFELDSESLQREYNMSKWFLNMTTEQMVELIKEFNSDLVHYSNPYKDAVDGIKKLSTLDEVVALTSFSDNPIQIRNRKFNIKAHFGSDIKDVISLPLNADKSGVLKDLKSSLGANVLVEDNIDHAWAAEKLGYKTFIIEHSYNIMGSEGLNVVSSNQPWNEIYEQLR